MRVPTQPPPAEGALDFEALDQALEALSGRSAVMHLATLLRWPTDEEREATPVGVIKGVLRLITEEDLVDRPHSAQLPAGAVGRGEMALMVGIGTATLAISDVDLVHADHRDGVLRIQVGPLLTQIEVNPRA